MNIGLSIGVKASVVYVLSSLLSRGVAIITMPIFTRLMSTEQVGVVNLFTLWNSTLEIFATCALTSGGLFVAMKEFSDDRNRYLSSILTLTTLISLFLIVVCCMFSKKFEEMLGLSKLVIVFMFIGFVFTPARDFFLARQRYEYKYKTSGTVTIMTAFFASLVSVVAVVFANKKGVKALGEIRLFSSFIVTYGISLFFWIYIFIKGGVKINFSYWKYSLVLSIPLMGNALASQILNMSDRVMISKMVNNSAVGIYSVLYSATSLSLIVWSAINNSFVPFLFEKIGKDEEHDSIKRRSTQIMLVYSGAAVLLTLIAPEIIRFLATEDYYESIYIMPPIAAGIFLTSIHHMYSNILLYYKKSQFIMLATSFAAIVNVMLNYFGIRRYGYMAAAYTTLLAHIVLALIQAAVSKRAHFKQTGKNNSVYDDFFLFVLCTVTVILCLLCLPLYKFTYMRYVFVLLGMLVFFAFRNKVIAIFRGFHFI